MSGYFIYRILIDLKLIYNNEYMHIHRCKIQTKDFYIKKVLVRVDENQAAWHVISFINLNEFKE